MGSSGIDLSSLGLKKIDKKNESIVESSHNGQIEMLKSLQKHGDKKEE